jgi:hypothetical protein
MANIASPTNPSALQEVDPLYKASRVALRPFEGLARHSVGAVSGAVTGLASTGVVFSLRNTSTSNNLLISRMGMGYITTTAFTAAQKMDYGLFVARAFTLSDSGGTAIPMTGNNTKLRTSLATPTGVDMRISTTTAIVSGTRTLDASPIAVIGGFSTGVGVVINTTPDNLLSQYSGEHPLILAPNEGIVLMNTTIMGATGVGTVYVNLEFAEVAAAMY